MCAPPKIAVFVFVLTIHLAILAFAFPRLDLADPAQITAAASNATMAGTEQKSVSTDANSSDRQPSTEPEAHTSPVQLHRPDEQGAEQHAGEKRRGPVVTQDLHQHSLAENTASITQNPDAEAKTETAAAKSDRVVTVLPAPANSAIRVIKDSVAEPSATAKPELKPVTLAQAEQRTAPADAVSIPKPKPVAATPEKPEGKPITVRRPTSSTSTKAGSGRMSNLRPLKDGPR